MRVASYWRIQQNQIHAEGGSPLQAQARLVALRALQALDDQAGFKERLGMGRNDPKTQVNIPSARLIWSFCEQPGVPGLHICVS